MSIISSPLDSSAELTPDRRLRPDTTLPQEHVRRLAKVDECECGFERRLVPRLGAEVDRVWREELDILLRLDRDECG